MIEQKEASDFDRWVAALQEAILEREQAMFSARVLAEARCPQNMGVMDDFDAYGLVFGPCGDTMEIFLRLDGGRIEKAAFMTDGCGPTVACGSILTSMVRGKSPAQAAAIETEELITALDGLPPEHIHCATLAVNTLREAIADCRPEASGGSG
ncbi:MAG: iron-sulfur cluster assembly scaffold protein [Anaerolineae bacterium]|nr:iron-sulfur cluster assembly scaffold protein [Anaerolineae bacterium]